MPRKIASRKNAKPSSANGNPKIGPAKAMKAGHSRPSSNESTVPETAPTANRIAVPRAQRWARASAAASFFRSHHSSAIAISTGIAMPMAAKTIWNASDIAIWERAAARSLTGLYCDMERPMSLRSINPATDELVREYPEPGDKELAMALAEASCAAAGWRRTSFADRAPKMRRAADLLDERKEELARLMAIEMGKPLAGGRSETEKCAWVCRYYADNAERFLAPEPVETDARRSFVAFVPLGPVLAVMPWNFPLWQVFRFAAPALMAGNAGLLKHAANVSGCALAIEQVFKDAGFPAPLFRALLVASRRVEGIIAAPEVKAVTLTGSTPAGRAVAGKAGAMLKKTVLELGGSDPYLVLEDADLELAAETRVASRPINSGQSCIAAKRFIVVEPVRKRFEEMFVEKRRKRKMGDPLEPGVEVGPQARRDLRDDLHRHVQDSLKAGARLLLGGQ